MNPSPTSIKTLIAFLERKPSLQLIQNGKISHIAYSYKDENGIFFVSKTGKYFSYERLTTEPNSSMEPTIEFETFCFKVEKGENIKRVYHYQ